MGKRLPKGFYWRGGIVWLRTDPLTGRPLSTKCHDPSSAQKFREHRDGLAANPAHAAALAAKVGEWILKVIHNKRHVQKKREGTLHMYTVKLGHVARIFGKDEPLSVINAGSVDDYIAQRQDEGAKNNTIARELTCLRQLLRMARRAKVYPYALDEVMPIGFSSEYEPVKRVLPKAALATLLDALDENQKAWVCLALSCAGDVSDVEQAQPADYNRNRDVMMMRGKKTSDRTAPVPILPIFRELFDYALPRLPVSWPRVSKDLPEICIALGIGHISPKDLRRTAATWLIESGAQESAVSRFLRHGDNAMVRKVYGQVQPEALRDLIADQTSAKTLQSITRPLGGTAYAGDLKNQSSNGANKKHRAQPGLGGRNGAPVGADWHTDSLQSAIELRRQRLLLLAQLEPGAERPGLALCRGLEAAYKKDFRTVRTSLKAAAGALGLT